MRRYDHVRAAFKGTIFPPAHEMKFGRLNGEFDDRISRLGEFTPHNHLEIYFFVSMFRQEGEPRWEGENNKIDATLVETYKRTNRIYVHRVSYMIVDITSGISYARPIDIKDRPV